MNKDVTKIKTFQGVGLEEFQTEMEKYENGKQKTNSKNSTTGSIIEDFQIEEPQMSQGDLLKEYYSKNNTNTTSSISDNNGIVSIKVPQAKNYNDCFNNILIGNLSSNMYDAANGDFIDPSRVDSEYWLDKELIFNLASNGTYLVSVIDENGKKIPMGYTDVGTYNEYMASYVKWNGSGIDEKGKYQSSTYGDGTTERFYEDGTSKRFDNKGNIIEKDETSTNVIEDTSTGVGYGSSTVGGKYTYSLNVDGYSAKHYESGKIAIIKNGVETELTGKYIESTTADGRVTRNYLESGTTVVLDGTAVVGITTSNQATQSGGETSTVVGDTSTGVGYGSSTVDGKYTYSLNVDGYSAKYYESGKITIIKNGVETELTGKYIESTTADGKVTRNYLESGVTVTMDGSAIVGIEISRQTRQSNGEKIITHEHIDSPTTTVREYNDGSKEITSTDGRSAIMDANGKVTGDLELFGVNEYKDSSNTITQTRSDGSVYIEHSNGSSAVKNADGSITGDSTLFGTSTNKFSGLDNYEISDLISEKCIEAGLTDDQTLMAIAISRFETGNYVSPGFENKNNLGGMMGSNGLRTYGNLDEGINSYINNLQKNYFSKGLNTISDIQRKYCPGSDGQIWINGVTSIYNELKASFQ